MLPIKFCEKNCGISLTILDLGGFIKVGEKCLIKGKKSQKFALLGSEVEVAVLIFGLPQFYYSLEPLMGFLHFSPKRS